MPSSVVSWLPLYHDMGLMVGLFIPLFVGCPVILTSPEAFIRKPARWMQLLAKHQAPFSAAPNFAFDLAVAKTSEEDMAGLDLGHVNTIINGAEQVQPNTITKFLRRFRPYNLMPAAVKPSYGMAEAVVYLATTKAGSPPTSTEFDADSLARGHAELSTFETERATRLIRYHSDDKEPLLGLSIRTRISSSDRDVSARFGFTVRMCLPDIIMQTTRSIEISSRPASGRPLRERQGRRGFARETWDS